MSDTPEVTHDRHVTATLGTVKRGRWSYPARVYNGVTQYQDRQGAWLDASSPVAEVPDTPAE